VASENHIYKFSNAGGFKSLTRYVDMLAGNTTWSPWEPAGAYDALATVTVPSGGAASITFAGIPTGYKHLQVRGIWKNNRPTFTYDNMVLQYNGDTSTTNYAAHQLNGDGASATAAAFTSASGTGIAYPETVPNNSVANTFGAFVIDILDYANTSKNKTNRVLSGFDTNGAGRVSLASGLWLNTSAITSITLASFNGSWVQNSTFALYGIK
jgi:hypothetical protein